MSRHPRDAVCGFRGGIAAKLGKVAHASVFVGQGVTVMAAERTDRPDNVPLGILYMVGATMVFAGVNALVKWEVALYPVGEVAFFRTLFALIPILLVILPRRGLTVFRTDRFRDHFRRAVSQLGSMTCIFIAFKTMPLAGATAISFSAPLITTLLSVLLLREAVGIHRWGALIVGFMGVLLVTHPGSGAFEWGTVFALANAVLISTVAIAIRQMSQTESSDTLIVYQLLLLVPLTALLLPFGFDMPTGPDFLLLLAAGLGNGIAQFWWTKALHLAPASAVSPFNYLSLVWAIIVGFIIWGDLPTTELILGSVVVVISGLYLLWRETPRREAPPVPKPAETL
jgi:drug/metabolite transporter (DMT)-like permease